MEQAVSERFPFRLVPVRGPVVRMELGTPSQYLRDDEIGFVEFRNGQKKLAEESSTVWATVFSYLAGRAPLHKDFVDNLRSSLVPGSSFAEIFAAVERAAEAYKASLPPPPPAVPEPPPAGDAPDAPPVTTDGDAAA